MSATFAPECDGAFKSMSAQESPNDFLVCGFQAVSYTHLTLPTTSRV